MIKKKDVIYTSFMKTSSGLLVIGRVLEKGLLKEIIDEEDKRAKLMSLTEKGGKTLAECHVALRKVAEDLYGRMPAQEMGQCIEYLAILEVNIAQRWHKIKNLNQLKDNIFHEISSMRYGC